MCCHFTRRDEQTSSDDHHCTHDQPVEKLPYRVMVRHHDKDGWVVIDQIRTIDKIRIVKVLDKLTDKEITQIKEVIKETMVD